MEKEAMRAAKLESRLTVLTKGYITREAVVRKDMETTWQSVQTAEQVTPRCALLTDLLHARKSSIVCSSIEGQQH